MHCLNEDFMTLDYSGSSIRSTGRELGTASCRCTLHFNIIAPKQCLCIYRLNSFAMPGDVYATSVRSFGSCSYLAINTPSTSDNAG